MTVNRRRPQRFSAFLGLLAILSGCGKPSNPDLALNLIPRGDSTLIRLVPVDGTQINARNPPAFERPDGSVLRFDSPRIASDSNYFVDPPELVVLGKPKGTVIASVCSKGERVCRTVSFGLR